MPPQSGRPIGALNRAKTNQELLDQAFAMMVGWQMYLQENYPLGGALQMVTQWMADYRELNSGRGRLVDRVADTIPLNPDPHIKASF